MKKALSVLLTLCMILTSLVGFTVTTSADETSGTCGESLTWSYDSATATLTISGQGDMYDYTLDYYNSLVTTSAPWKSYNRTMRTVIIEDSVTSVGEYAFLYGVKLTSLTIGSSVKSIGEGAFFNCVQLKTVCNSSKLVMEKGSSENGYAAYHAENIFTFYGAFSENLIWAYDTDTRTLFIVGEGDMEGYNYSGGQPWEELISDVEKVVIGDGVRSIGACAFCNFDGVKSLTIGSSVTSIADGAFCNCTGLTEVTVPRSVTSIVGWAFFGCSSLKTVYNQSTLNIVKGSTENGFIAEAADNVYTTGGTCGDSLIWDYAFDTDTLTISGEGDMKDYTSEEYEGAYVTSAPWRFYCNTMKTLIIGNFVTSVGRGAFDGCTALTSVTIGYSVKDILSNAFRNCDVLTEVTVSDYAKTIGDSAFYGCDNLKTVTIGRQVESISKSAFESCVELQSVTLGQSVTGIDDATFKNCYALESIVIPDSVKFIGTDAFMNCFGLNTVTIGHSVESIGASAFEACTALKTVYNSSMIDIVKGSTENGYVAYYADNVYTIGGPCGKYLIWDYDLDTDTLTISGDGDMKDYTSEKHEGAYITSAPWKIYCNTMKAAVIGGYATSVGQSAFEGCTALTSVTFGFSTCDISSNAFRNCDGLTEVTFSDYTTNIGDYAFYGCDNLKTVAIGKSVNSIGASAFERCSALKTVYNKSKLDIVKGSSESGYVAYYADNVYKPDENGHCKGKAVVVTAPTCTEAGFTQYKCYFCDEILEEYNEVTAPLNHDLIHHDAKAPACTEVGWEAYDECSRCDYTTYAEIPKLGHKLVTLPGKMPTLTEVGWNAYEACTRCDYSTYEEIPAIAVIVYSGKCGDNLTWEYDFNSATIKLTGEGDMYDYSVENNVTTGPWKSFYKYIKSIVIFCGVTGIGKNAFYGCDGLVVVVIADSVKKIGDDAFAGCGALNTIFNQSKLEIISGSADNGRIAAVADNVYILDIYGHVRGEAIVVTAPTCTETGLTQYKCPHCNEIIEEYDEITPAPGHNFVDKLCTRCDCNEYGCTQGDVDDDGKIGQSDLNIVQKSVTGTVNLSESEAFTADVNGDGKVTAVDIILIQKYVVGVLSSFKPKAGQ